jgi:hypothetical protein
MASVGLSPVGIGITFTNPAGQPLVGGKVFTYIGGTTTPQSTWTTSAANVLNGNPIILNSAGQFPQEVWLSFGALYKFTITDSAGNTLQVLDNISPLNDQTGFSEWIVQGAPTYLSATSFSMVGNQTAVFDVGRRVKSQNTAGTIYSTVSASSYSGVANTTTVTVVNDSGVLDSGLSSVAVGLLDPAANSIGTPLTFGAGAVTFGGPVNVGGALAVTGNETVGGNETVTGTLNVTGTTTLNNTSVTGTLTVTGNVSPHPTRTVLRTAGSGTYTTPAGAVRLNVRAVGGGGGGGGCGSSGGSNGGSGGNTVFGTFTANGGGPGLLGTGGAAGTGGAGGGTAGSPDIRINGAQGASCVAESSGPLTGNTSGMGGNSVFGGGGPYSITTGSAGAANSGGGGSGAGNSSNTTWAGGGGGAGGYFETLIISPNATYSYTVGSAGTAGTAGTSGNAGGLGGTGQIIVDEYYY